MKETIEKILSQVPRYTEIYVFGSVLKSLQPNDLDILIIYDSKAYPKANIYNSCKSIREVLYEIINLPVDLTVLSYYENYSMNFVKEINAIKLEYFLQSKFFKERILRKY